MAPLPRLPGPGGAARPYVRLRRLHQFDPYTSAAAIVRMPRRTRRPPIDCIVCGQPTPDSCVGQTAMCPGCTAQVKDTVARQSRPYRTSERGCSRD